MNDKKKDDEKHANAPPVDKRFVLRRLSDGVPMANGSYDSLTKLKRVIEASPGTCAIRRVAVRRRKKR